MESKYTVDQRMTRLREELSSLSSILKLYHREGTGRGQNQALRLIIQACRTIMELENMKPDLPFWKDNNGAQDQQEPNDYVDTVALPKDRRAVPKAAQEEASIRDMYAAAVLQGLIANPGNFFRNNPSLAVEEAFKTADYCIGLRRAQAQAPAGLNPPEPKGWMDESFNKGFRLPNGTIDNSQCPHLHFIDYKGKIRCQVCGRALDSFKGDHAPNPNSPQEESDGKERG